MSLAVATEVHMPNWSEVRGLIAPVTIGVVATVALGYSTNELTSR